MIEPTVGRIVWVNPDDAIGEENKGPLAAIITYVHSDTCVNLCVFDMNGNPQPRTRVRLVQPEDVPSATTSLYCFWMPFQIKKATGSESGEKEVGVESI